MGGPVDKGQAKPKPGRPESVASKRGGMAGRWNKLQREGSIRSSSPNALVDKIATAARIVNRLKTSTLKKVLNFDLHWGLVYMKVEQIFYLDHSKKIR